MTFEIKDYFETPVILEPRVELYTVYDFMGKELPGLAIVLDMPIQGADEKEHWLEKQCICRYKQLSLCAAAAQSWIC